MLKPTQLTTHQVARLCKVATRTVTKWHSSGVLRAVVGPDGRDRHYRLADVMDLMVRHAIPMDSLHLGIQRIGMVALDADSVAAIRQVALPMGISPMTYTNSLAGGFALAADGPRVIFFNGDALEEESFRAVRWHSALQLSRYVAVVRSVTPAVQRKWRNAGFHEVESAPVTSLMAARLLAGSVENTANSDGA